MRNGAYVMYDVAPDDQRFVMLQIGDADEAAASELILVTNWFEELSLGIKFEVQHTSSHNGPLSHDNVLAYEA